MLSLPLNLWLWGWCAPNALWGASLGLCESSPLCQGDLLQVFALQPRYGQDLQSTVAMITSNITEVQHTCLDAVERLEASHNSSSFQGLAGGFHSKSSSHAGSTGVMSHHSHSVVCSRRAGVSLGHMRNLGRVLHRIPSSSGPFFVSWSLPGGKSGLHVQPAAARGHQNLVPHPKQADRKADSFAGTSINCPNLSSKSLETKCRNAVSRSLR